MDNEEEILMDQDRYVHKEINQNTVNFTAIDFDLVSNLTIWEIYSNWIQLDQLVENPSLKRHPSHSFIYDLYQKNLVWKFVLNLLFKPGPKLVDIMKIIQKEYGIQENTFKVGIHVRQGDEGMNKKRAISNELWLSRYPKTNEDVTCFAQRAVELWNDLPKNRNFKKPVFFVASDHFGAGNRVIKYLRSQKYLAFTTHRYTGKTKHIKFSYGEEQTKTLLDWFLLSQMHKLIITYSGYSTSASKFTCAPTLIFYAETTERNCENFFIYEINGLCHPDFVDY